MWDDLTPPEIAKYDLPKSSMIYPTFPETRNHQVWFTQIVCMIYHSKLPSLFYPQIIYWLYLLLLGSLEVILINHMCK